MLVGTHGWAVLGPVACIKGSEIRSFGRAFALRLGARLARERTRAVHPGPLHQDHRRPLECRKLPGLQGSSRC